MAGHPIKRAMLAALSDKGGIDYVLDRVANGDTMWSIAADLNTSRNVLADWLNVDAERKAMYLAARAASSQSMAEQALDIADAATELGTSKARLQIETRQWLAGIYNRDVFGPKTTGVTVNIGSLHLDSLRRAAANDAASQVIDTKALAE